MDCEVFAEIRKKIGSQHKVANLLGVCQAQISIWEKGYKTIPEDISEKIKQIKPED